MHAGEALGVKGSLRQVLLGLHCGSPTLDLLSDERVSQPHLHRALGARLQATGHVQELPGAEGLLFPPPGPHPSPRPSPWFDPPSDPPVLAASLEGGARSSWELLSASGSGPAFLPCGSCA